MAGAFESVTRVAIEDLIQSHAQASKFGYVITPDGFRDLTNDLYDLLLTSRSLKSAGDRFLQGQSTGVTSSTPTRTQNGKRLLR